MPIKWSPLMVSEAMDMVEEYVNQAVEPLEQASGDNALKVSRTPFCF